MVSVRYEEKVNGKVKSRLGCLQGLFSALLSPLSSVRSLSLQHEPPTLRAGGMNEQINYITQMFSKYFAQVQLSIKRATLGHCRNITHFEILASTKF